MWSEPFGLSLRDEPVADDGLAMAEARQFPDTRACRILVSADIRIDQIRPSGRDTGLDGIAEIAGLIDADAFDTGGARHRGEVGIVGRARIGIFEIRDEFA